MMVFIARRERVIAIAIFGLSELVNSNLEEKHAKILGTYKR